MNHQTLSRQNNCASNGQALIEFTLIATSACIMLLAVSYVGMGMYQAHMASDAVKEIRSHEMTFARQPGSVGAGQLQGLIAGGVQGSLAGASAFVDGVALGGQVGAANQAQMTLVVGRKTYTAPLFNSALTLNFTSVEGIRSALLMPHGGNQAPQTGLNKPSIWQQGQFNQVQSSYFKLNDDRCQGRTPTNTLMPQPAGSYVLPPSALSALQPTRATRGTILAIAESMPNTGVPNFTGQCSAERNALMPRAVPPAPTPPPPPVVGPPPLPPVNPATGLPIIPPASPSTITYDNPPGAPGKRVTVTIGPNGQPIGNPTFTPAPGVRGLYTDPSGQYNGPPGDFVSSCNADRQMAWKIQRAITLAEQIIDTSVPECRAITVTP